MPESAPPHAGGISCEWFEPLLIELAVACEAAIPPDVAGLWTAVRRDKRCLVRRDARYLQWRYVDRPARRDYKLWTVRRRGEFAGLMVLKPEQGLAPDAATIAEWLVPEQDVAALDALLAVATRRRQEAGQQRLLAVFPQWAPEWRTLLQRGFLPTALSTWLQRRLVHNINKPAITAEFLASNWWFTLGGTDLA
jgi:hypothetical protein